MKGKVVFGLETEALKKRLEVAEQKYFEVLLVSDEYG